MPKFTLEIEMSNAAFEDNSQELRDCLRRVREALGSQEGQASGAVRDSYGNVVGHWQIVTE